MSGSDVFEGLSGFRRTAADTNGKVSPEMAEMRKNRAVNRRVASTTNGGGGGAGVSFATGRPRDPMFYWKQNNLPFDTTKIEELIQLRGLCRAISQTNPVIASAIDIYSKYPLTGMELQCKDPALKEFYEELFFDQLDYEDFLVDIGREYWTVGEAFPFGSFNETLGVWEDDELLNPDDIDVIRSPFFKEPRMEMKLPEALRNIIRTREPAWEYEALIRSYPELQYFANDDRALMPVSNVLLRHLKFKGGDTFNPRGVPIMLRALRAIIQEEMLNAAQDAIASRLYTPLVLAKLGASASDLGTDNPWVPDEGDLATFEEALDAALAADFRVLIHHFAVDMKPIFGRETMPRMDQDFDRLTKRQLQAFGLSETMLSGGQSGQTYAADALNRDLITQLLTGFQRLAVRHYQARATVVAEAQRHYDYRQKGSERYPIMEEVLVVDEETGEERIEEQPKLLIPEMNIRVMNLKDDESLRQFYEALRSSGVPISDETRLVNVPIDLANEIEKTKEEQVNKAVEAQLVRRETYMALKEQGLPIPEDLMKDFGAVAVPDTGGDANPSAETTVPALLGQDEPAPIQALVPTEDDIAASQVDGVNDGLAEQPAAGGDVVRRLPTNRMLDSSRPAESDEMRKDMPKASQKIRRQAVAAVTDADGVVTEEAKPEEWVEPETLVTDGQEAFHEGAGRMMSGPRHIGMRRSDPIDKDKAFSEQGIGWETEEERSG